MTTSLDPTWVPDANTVAAANVTELMRARAVESYEALHAWSVADRAGFWQSVIERLGIVFDRPPSAVLDMDGAEDARWLVGARLNIAASCFTVDPEAPAVLAAQRGEVEVVTSGQLREIVMRVASGLRRAGLRVGDRVAIAMPMTLEAVAGYLGTVWAGGVVVSIADSFAPEEIATRLRITETSVVLTQDVIHRAGKTLPMYAKVVEAGAARAIVVTTGSAVELRDGDTPWREFLAEPDDVAPVVASPETATNILFSSGTTGDPKAIPWTHTTPIKPAMDARFHHDVRAGDVVAWPTNLGWMMGPWLIYSSLLNGAAMALYDDVPTERGFGEFVQDAGVTMLGLVPSLVAAWRSSQCMEGLDWGALRVFSSTGEASNQSDMAYLMTLAGPRPVIEYCGGTEIGGGYLAGTVVQPSIPSTFTTPALGLDLRLVDEDGAVTSSGEVFLVPPSIGLSHTLLNRDHHEVYYAGTPRLPDAPVLRRHGDHIERLPGGYYRAHGRIDDTMNLGGIKVSSAEIERVVGAVGGVAHAAAIAVEPAEGGPSRLVIVAEPVPGHAADPDSWREEMQAEIRAHLNPLFKIHEVVVAEALPRTASAKVMRRALRTRHSPSSA
jgi:acetyl-CoA synthetase